MAKIDFSTSQELCSLIEYCRIYKLDATDFTGEFLPGIGKGTMLPDLQSQRHNIGIECTEAGLSCVYRATNDKIKDQSPTFACL